MRFKNWILACLFSTGMVVNAHAGWWERAKVDYHRMNMYPQPFTPVDNEAVRAPFVVMVERGWQRQTTLGDEHFDAETNQLSRAGELKVRWILTQAPESRRQVYVLRGHSDDVTSTRIDSVQLATSRIIQRGPLPNILATDVPSVGWPAEYVNEVDKKMQSTIPPPRLPDASAAKGS